MKRTTCERCGASDSWWRVRKGWMCVALVYDPEYDEKLSCGYLRSHHTPDVRARLSV